MRKLWHCATELHTHIDELCVEPPFLVVVVVEDPNIRTSFADFQKCMAPDWNYTSLEWQLQHPTIYYRREIARAVLQSADLSHPWGAFDFVSLFLPATARRKKLNKGTRTSLPQLTVFHRISKIFPKQLVTDIVVSSVACVRYDCSGFQEEVKRHTYYYTTATT